MAQAVEWKTGNPKVQGSHLKPQHFEVVCFWAWFIFNIKLLSKVRESDGEDGRAVNSETLGCGFYPHMGQIFMPTFIKFNINKVLVEACLKNSLLQYSSLNGTPWCSAIPGFEPMPLL